MSIELGASRSRRALLTAVAGAAAATVVSTIDRPARILAGADGDVVLGAQNNAGSTTLIMGQPDLSEAVLAVEGSDLGIQGASEYGTAILGLSWYGTALQVAGKAKFSRSGKATVLKGKSYADITVAGGLTTHSVIHATLQTYRTGVAIAAVRINYPSTGKARIYLTKVASTTASTYVGWFVAEY